MSRRTDQMQQMRVFAMVAAQGNFARAANALSLPASSISKTIAQLEARLETVLIRRTTRAIQLTDDGKEYLRSVKIALFEIDRVEDRVRAGNRPKGKLHVTVPVAFGESFLSPMLPAFCANYPDLLIDFDTDRRYLDMVSHNIDVAVRTMKPEEDSAFIALKLLPHVNFLVASPEYLDRFGVPQSMEGLNQHRLMYFDWPKRQGQWQMRIDGRPIIIHNEAVFRTNSYHTLKHGAVSGMGIANLPADYAVDYLKSGELVRVLPEVLDDRGHRVALYHERRAQSPKTDVFLDFLVEATAKHKANLADLGFH
ncbi:LysR family transcriptional regulator [Maritalea sp.]|uniref:LysR family transcriptional regulator n=1 Tax=Maritalea sp. TaxID=2003361 RepID=UPI003EF955C5